MSILLISLITLSIALVGFIFYGYIQDEEGWTIFGVIGLILVGLIGFGVIATTNTNDTIKMDATVYEILIGRKLVVVCTKESDKPQIINGYEMEKITKDSKFYWSVKLNHYGYEIEKTLKVK